MKNFYRLIIFSLSVLLMLGCSGNKSADPAGNRAPAAPSGPSPANNATAIGTTVTMTWQCSDPDNDPMTYDIYLGTQQPPPQITTGLTGTSYQATALQTNTTYYWMVTAKDSADHSTNSPVWHFVTGGQSGIELIGHFGLPGIKEVEIDGNYVYALTTSQVLAVDVSDPTIPRQLGSYTTYGIHFKAAQHNAIVLDTRSLRIISFTDPAHPVSLGYYTGDHGGSESWLNLLVDELGWSVTVSGIDSLHYLDTRNPPNIQQDGASPIEHVEVMARSSEFCGVQNPYSGQRRFVVVSSGQILRQYVPVPDRATDLMVNGDYAFITCNTFGLFMIRVSDVTFSGSYPTGSHANAVAVAGDYAYLACDTAGVKIINIANPANPVIAGSYHVTGGASDIELQNGYVFVASGTGGIYVLRFNP